MKNIAASLRRAQFFSAHISLQQGNSEATGAARLDVEQRKEIRTRQPGTDLHLLPTRHLQSVSQRRYKLAQGSGPPCLTGHRLPPESEVEMLPLSIKLPSGV